MKKFISNSFKLLSGGLLAVSSPALFTLTSCSKKDAIQFANFESYMADDLIKDLQSKYDIQFPYYTVAEMIPAKFERFYDLAVPCGYELVTLLRNGWLEEIEWPKFGIEGINSAEDAKSLFISDGIDAMNEQFTQYIKEQPEGDPLKKYLVDGKFQILRFGVPYFAQSFMFAYTGSELTFYESGTENVTSSPTWADIFYTISPANPHRDERFNKKKIGMVDDARSFHDVSRIVEWKEDKEPEENLKLIPTRDSSINSMQTTMKHITDKFDGQTSFVLNSDSAIVSRGLADRKGDQTAVLSWSGDTIYAAQGAEEFEAFTSENFHIKKASDASFNEIEYVVMNNKNLNDKSKRDDIYNIVKQICLDGCKESAEEIVRKEDDSYVYWSMTNWDTVMYTPMLKNIHTAVTDVASTYWQEQISEGKYSPETVTDLFIPILNGESIGKPLYGLTMSNLQNSNNHWAWLEQRGRL